MFFVRLRGSVIQAHLAPNMTFLMVFGIAAMSYFALVVPAGTGRRRSVPRHTFKSAFTSSLCFASHLSSLTTTAVKKPGRV